MRETVDPWVPLATGNPLGLGEVKTLFTAPKKFLIKLFGALRWLAVLLTGGRRNGNS